MAESEGRSRTPDEEGAGAVVRQHGCTDDALPGCHVTPGKPCDCGFIIDTMLDDAEREANS